MAEVTLFWGTGSATCIATKAYFKKHNVEYRSLNIHEDPVAVQEWDALGRPPIPGSLVDGTFVSIFHPSQLAPLLGIEDDDFETTRLAWDLVHVQEDWLTVLRSMDHELMRTPTPSRGRSTIELVVNVFSGLDLLPTAWERGFFEWPAAKSVEDLFERYVTALLLSEQQVIDFAAGPAARWQALVLDNFAGDNAEERSVSAPDRGTVPFATLLASQRWHASLHLSQVTTFLELEGRVVPGLTAISQMTDLELPNNVFYGDALVTAD